MKRFLITLIVVLLGLPVAAQETHVRCFSSPNVPIDDPVYRDIDKLVSAGLIKDAIYGQRPWSRGEIARLIVEAKLREKDLGILAPDERAIGPLIMADTILKRLEAEYHEELVDRGDGEGEARQIRLHPLEKAEFDYTILDSPFRVVPVENGLGSIDAVVNPLVSYREGRHYVDGSTLGFETTHSARLSKFFSVYARPRFEALVPNAGSSAFNPIVQQLYGKFAYRNLEIEVGRDSVIWGPGEHGGVLSSNNARPLDMIKLTSSAPFYHPWIFKYLGPSKYTFFLADLGPQYNLKNAILNGFAVSIKPVSFLEMGIEHEMTFDGEGAPQMGLGDFLSEFFLIRQSGAHANSGPNFADHRVGAYLHANIPPLKNAQFYAEGVFEDLGHASFWPQFVQQMGFLSGLYFPLLSADGSNSLRIEYEHSPGAYGRHSMWSSGLSLNQRLRGSEMGPDGKGLLLEWNHNFLSGLILESSFHYEDRGNDVYSETISSRGGPDRVFKTVDNPNEHRLRLMAALSVPIRERLKAGLQFGYEYVWNNAFVLGATRNNFLGSLSLEWRPGY